MSMDSKDYLLNTPMDTPEYMKVHYKHIPTDIKSRYNLNLKVTTDNYQYIKIKKGMYGLRQAAILAYKYLQTTLQPFRYFPIPGTVGMWKHHTRPIHFCLCFDDFGIKYFNKNDVQHLQQAISTVFQYSTDWSGNFFCGMQFDWNYTEGYVDVSMPNYVEKALKRLGYIPNVP